MEHNETHGGVAQVGGTHYGQAYGHWDYCKRANTPYLEGHATKYLGRWRRKGGIQDLEKSLSFVEKIMVGNENTIWDNPAKNFNGYLDRYIKESHVGDVEALLTYAILNWKSYQDLAIVREQLKQYIDLQVQAAALSKAFNEFDSATSAATSAYTNQGK